MHEDPVIEVHNLAKSYGTAVAASNISFAVERGEIFGMVGPNGAGKTTTIECVEGLREPDAGTIRVLGLNPQSEGYALREKIGLQLQESGLYPRIKVWEALDLFASFYRAPTAWEELLSRLHLEEKRNTHFDKLSGGQKQRLFIAMSLVHNPELVFFDELSTGLDPLARRDMWDLMRNVREQGKTIFLTTHFMEEAERLCDRVAILHRGRVIALDTPANLVAGLGAEHRVVFSTKSAIGDNHLRNLASVSKVERIGDRYIVYGKGERMVADVINSLSTNGNRFHDLRTEQPTLEDVFLSLTGSEIEN